MPVQLLQTTTNFVIKYDDSNSDAKSMAQAILAVCESEFTVLTGWFAINTGFGSSDRITVTVQSIASGGANNYGYQSGGNTTINVNFLPSGYTTSQADQMAPSMFVLELVEVFMSFNNQKTGKTTWEAGHSDGEGLSQFCGILRFPGPHYIGYGSWANSWLSSPTRTDYITTNELTDGNPVSFGCVLLFLFYLNTQLGFSPAQIIQNGGATPAETYTNLTGDTSDPFGFFLYLINTTFPGTATITGSPGPALDDPFPIFTLQFWDNKNTFSKAEVSNHVTQNEPFTDALLLVLEGFSPVQWNALGSPNPIQPALRPPSTFPGIGFTQPQIVFENPALLQAPQRIHFHYNVTFDSTSPDGFGTDPQNDELDSSITISGQIVNANTEITFYGKEDPYFVTFNKAAGNASWLSEDLRVFTSTANGNPVPGGPPFNTDTIAGARAYLKDLLTHLNLTFGDPARTDPFDPSSNVIPGQTDALQGDSSVIPNTSFLGTGGANTYNFAIARVRLNGDIGLTSAPVKVFFRLWSSTSPDTHYAPTTTYNSHLDSSDLPDWPLPAPDSSTFPFFATATNGVNTDSSDPEFGHNGVNHQVITIDHELGQWTYFGCLLNVYDNTYIINGLPVTQRLAGTHHCLVAQIASDDAPIQTPPGVLVAPGNTDKLAQRNLQITPAFNSTPPFNLSLPLTNLVPQTFDLGPSSPRKAMFDELLIDWGNTPVGSIGSIYWPGASAELVLALANRRYASHSITVSDEHTITCPITGSLTYVPIPLSEGANLAGLLTVELAQNVRQGQQFSVIVRRVTTTIKPAPIPRSQLPPVPQIQSSSVGPFLEQLSSSGELQLYAPPVGKRPTRPIPPGPPIQPRPDTWRTIAGAFQVNIPVKGDDEILPFDEETLSIFKWRLSVMPRSDRWFPVMQLYIRYLSQRIDGHGGNSNDIPASPTGLTHPVLHYRIICGKVKKIVYDGCGDFKGFVLGSCDGEHAFETCERGIEHVVLGALRNCTKIEVKVHNSGRIIGLALCG